MRPSKLRQKILNGKLIVLEKKANSKVLVNMYIELVCIRNVTRNHRLTFCPATVAKATTFTAFTAARFHNGGGDAYDTLFLALVDFCWSFFQVPMTPVTSIIYKKGSIVEQQVPFKAIRLEHCCTTESVAWTRQLPGYDPPETSSASKPSKMSRDFVKRCQRHNTLPVHAIVMCLEIRQDEKNTRNELAPNETPTSTTLPILTEEEEELVVDAWTWIQDSIQWTDWIRLYEHVRNTVRILYLPLVSSEYATKTLFTLDPHQLQDACRILAKECNITVPPHNKHALSQALVQLEKPVTYIIMVNAPYYPTATTRTRPLAVTTTHSCLPNVVLEYNHFKIQWIALYDIVKGESIEESLVESSSFGTHVDRAKALCQRFGPHYKCHCVKCTATLNDNNTTTTMTPSVIQMQRLGHAALLEGCHDEARRWYQRVLDVHNDIDVWHALGATYLQEGRFRKAQRVWRDASKTHVNHAGMALQVQKQIAYRYFEDRNNNKSTNTMRYNECFPSSRSSRRRLCFVTDNPIVSREQCQQVIQWAESSQQCWTTSRHYAVPTNDVPVHCIPKLLEWFNDWMTATVYNLLAQQFQLSPCYFYVHDAFVVRYQAMQQSNHLPCHYDESTHSLVLALNSDFEGGGTYFIDEDAVLNPKQAGILVSFRGDKLKHGGEVVTKGTRYIMAVFLYYDDSNAENDASIVTTKRKRSQWNASKENSFSFGFSVE